MPILLAEPVEEKDPLLDATFGSFRVVRRLGKGGMGTVYLGEHTSIGSRVAVKILHPQLASNPQLVARFYAEARAVNLIGHENIVNIFDMNVVPPDRYYLIMEYLEGQPLNQLAKGPLRPEVAIPILVQVCDALQAAHAHGVVHRDLKPENIFLVKRGRTEHFVKILDFGIAKLFATEESRETAQTSAGMIVGTPEYMSPEQCAGEPVDGRTDLYSLGIIAYQLATGRLPFVGGGLTGLLIAHREKAPRPPIELTSSVPSALSEVILRALAKRPEDRFRDAAEFREALETVAAALGPEQPPRPIPTPVPPTAPTPQPIDSRHAASFEATVTTLEGSRVGRFNCVDLSRGGAFLCADSGFPPLFTRIKLTLEPPTGPLLCTAEVVRHVNREQATAWNMPPGFAVQFVEVGPEVKQVIARLVKGLPPASPPSPRRAAADDPGAERVLATYRKRISGDHYSVLFLSPEAEISEVRARGRDARRELEALKARALSPSQLAQVDAALERVAQAMAVIGSARQRLDYDAARQNFEGVARCIAAGLSVSELEAARARFLETRPGTESRAEVQFATGQAYERRASFPPALDGYVEALRLDPLNLRYQQAYWGLKRKAQATAKKE